MQARGDVMIWIKRKAKGEERFIELHLELNSDR